MEWLKSQLASWKVRIALVGGAVVVATTFGTCSFDPGEVSSNTTTETTNETVEVSTTTEGPATAAETTETTDPTNTTNE